MKKTALLKLTAATALCVVLASCKNMSRSLTDEGFPNNHGNPTLTQFSGLQYDIPTDKPVDFPSTPTVVRTANGYTLSNQTDGQVERYNEQLRIKQLEYKKLSTPSKSEKYEKLIQEEVSKMQLARNERIQQRMTFLKGFYEDLYSMPQTEFTKKYKKHCSTAIKDAMQSIYEQNHGAKGYTWAIFGDNAIHTGKDISCSQPEGKSVDQNEKYPYYWLDNPWYLVQLGSNAVKIRLMGEGKDIVINSIVNPMFDIALDNDTKVIR